MKVIIADARPIVRKGLQQIISATYGMPAETANADALMAALRAEPFDVLFLDVNFENGSSLYLLGEIRKEFPSLAILMLNMNSNGQTAIRCLQAGADGYLDHDTAPQQVFEAITTVTSGTRYITQHLAAALADQMARRGELPHSNLSPREFEVFRLLALGRTATEIGVMLHLSVKTVSTYRSRILEKTGLRTNADITAYAIRNSLV